MTLAAILALPTITPNSNAIPGLSELANLVGALFTVAFLAAVAGVLLSSIVWAVGANSGNAQSASRGKMGVVWCAVAALLAGGATVIVTFAFNAGSQL